MFKKLKSLQFILTTIGLSALLIFGVAGAMPPPKSTHFLFFSIRPSVSISIDKDEVDEGQSATLTATLSKASISDVTVYLEHPLAVGGPIVNANDYSLPKNFTIPAGSLNASVNIETKSDNDFEEPDESLKVMISSVAGAIKGSPDSDILKIKNLGAGAAEVLLTANPETISKGGFTQLAWEIKNVNSCTTSSSPENSQWKSDVIDTTKTKGDVNITGLNSIGSNNFTLTCTGPKGEASDTVAVNVTDAAGGDDASTNGRKVRVIVTWEDFSLLQKVDITTFLRDLQ